MRKWLTPPVFDNDEKTATARLLYVLVGIIAAVSLFLILPPLIMQTGGSVAAGVQILGVLVVCAVVFWCAGMGWVRQASLILVTIFWLANSAAVWQGGGLHALAFANYVLIIFAAGLLLGSRAGAITAGLSALVGLGLLFSEQQSLLPTTKGQQTALGIWLSQVAIFAVVVALQAIASQSLREALRRAQAGQARYRLLVEDSPDGVLILDSDKRLLMANQTACRMSGYTADELTGRDGSALLDLQQVERQPLPSEQEAPEGGQPVRRGGLLNCKDGRRLPVVGNERLMPDGSLQFIFQAIDEDKQAKPALATSREKLTLALHSSPNAMLITTMSRETYLEVNDAFSRLTGYSAEEVLGKTTQELGWWVDMAERTAMRGELRARGHIRDMLIHFRHKSGEVLVGQVSAETIEIDGQACGLYTVTDVTERLKAEQELNQYADITRHMQVGMYVLQADDLDDDRSLRVIAANPAALKASEKTAEQVLGKTIDQATPSLRAKGFPAKYLQVLKTGEPVELEDHYFDDAGKLIEAYAVKVFRLSRDRVGVLFEDISGRRRAEQQTGQFSSELEKQVERRTAELESANRELEAFSYSVSHDLRAPLRGVLGFARLMEMDAAIAANPEALSNLQHIIESARKMNELIDAMLSISRVSRLELHLKAVDLSGVAASIIDGLRESDPARRVETTIAPGLRAHADETLLRSVLQNLIGNAWKFTAQTVGARIEFGAFPARDSYYAIGGTVGSEGPTFFVRDNGPGFDPADAERIFGVFQRLHTEEKFEGVGVGLAIVQRIIHRHGGQVWAESEPGKGAVFYFTLG